MRSIKAFVLAMLVALLAMAFAGASMAKAESTVLCSGDPGTGSAEPCPEGQVVEHIHETTLPGSKATLKTSLLTIECDVLFLGDVASEGSIQVISGNFTYTNCGSCTVTEENGPAEINVEKAGHELATVTGVDLVHVKCSGSLDCSYPGTNLNGHALGPLLSSESNGDVTITKQVITKEAGGFLCPKTAELTIKTTPLSATYIGSLEELEMVCIEVEAGEGFYLGYKNGTCTGEDEAAHGNYEMAYVLRGTPLLQHVCAEALWPRGVFNRSDWHTCTRRAWTIGTYILGKVMP